MSYPRDSQRKNVETGCAFDATLCRRARLVPNQAPRGFAPDIDLAIFAVRCHVHMREAELRISGTGH